MIPFILAAVGGYLIGDSLKNDTERFSEGGMMANGGEVRKIKGNNFGQQIENSQKFKELIQKAYESQGSEKYPLEFMKSIARTPHPIVKNDGKNYLKGYSNKGAITYFEFLDDSNFVKALEYVDRPPIRKFR